MNTRIASTSTTVALLAVLSGCIQVHDLPELDGGPPTSSRDGGAPWPDPASCTVADVVAGDTPLDVTDGTTVSATHHGSWTHLRHPADVAATLYVETLDAPAGGATAGAFLALREVGTTAELEDHPGGFYPGSFRVPLYAPEQDLFLFPTGASFRVRVCYEVHDPFPTCVASGDGGPPECPGNLGGSGELRDTGTWCTCGPPCLTAADCPIPSTGDVSPTCDGRGCQLSCDASSRCPDGQECMTRSDGSSVCMTRF